eukprot:5194187-Pyramimonas_sp.AAC.1
MQMTGALEARSACTCGWAGPTAARACYREQALDERRRGRGSTTSEVVPLSILQVELSIPQVELSIPQVGAAMTEVPVRSARHSERRAQRTSRSREASRRVDSR